jgi:membrane associated rhomboid family serine protease
MYDEHADEAPINTLPAMVLLLFLGLAGVEAVLQMAENGILGGPMGVGWRLELARNYGFSDSIFGWMTTNQNFPTEHLMRFVTYPVVHRDFMHAVFVCVFVLALGKFTSETLGQWVMIIVFFVSSVFGALAYALVLDEPGVLIGGYPGVFGLIGAFTWVQFVTLSVKNENRLQAFRLIAFFMGIQLLWKLLFGASNEWVAEIFAFGAGFILSVVIGPGGLMRVREILHRLRSR